jgi:type I restriction enzyme S subunit
MKLSPDPTKANSLFLYYLFKSPEMQGEIRSTAIGSSVPGFNLGNLRSLRFRLPSLLTQNAIAEFLGSLDDKIEQNRRTGRKLEELARAVFKAWFVDFEPVKAKANGATSFPGLPPAAFASLPTRLVESALGPIPEGWKLGPLTDFAEILSGGTPKTSEAAYWDGDMGWASAKDVSQCGELFLLDTERRITERGLQESATQIIPAFATVVVARGATTGRLTMFAEPFAMNQTCYALQCREQPFFFNLLCSHTMASMVQAAHGSVFDTITKSTIQASLAVIPPGNVLNQFESYVAPFFKAVLANAYESRKLAALRDYLLPKLLSGQVRVREAERLTEGAA